MPRALAIKSVLFWDTVSLLQCPEGKPVCPVPGFPSSVLSNLMSPFPFVAHVFIN